MLHIVFEGLEKTEILLVSKKKLILVLLVCVLIINTCINTQIISNVNKN